MKIDESITVVAYQTHWPHLFQNEQQCLQEILKDIVDIQHVGSTAVPGLAAKPIVDLLIGLQTFEKTAAPIAVLKTLGYEYLGEAGVPGRLYFRKRHPYAFNAHLVQWDSEQWNNNLLLKDFLREHPNAADRYGQHKQELIQRGITMLLAYSEKKGAVIAELLQCAQAWKV